MPVVMVCGHLFNCRSCPNRLYILDFICFTNTFSLFCGHESSRQQLSTRVWDYLHLVIWLFLFECLRFSTRTHGFMLLVRAVDKLQWFFGFGCTCLYSWFFWCLWCDVWHFDAIWSCYQTLQVSILSRSGLTPQIPKPKDLSLSAWIMSLQ